MGGGGGCQSTMLIEICTLYSLYDCLPSVSHSSSLRLLLIIHILHLFLSMSLVLSVVLCIDNMVRISHI
jgi:hypothetical protein